VYTFIHTFTQTSKPQTHNTESSKQKKKKLIKSKKEISLAKIGLCSDSATLKCYSAAKASIWQHFILNYLSQNNSDLFKFHYAIAVFDNTS